MTSQDLRGEKIPFIYGGLDYNYHLGAQCVTRRKDGSVVSPVVETIETRVLAQARTEDEMYQTMVLLRAEDDEYQRHQMVDDVSVVPTTPEIAKKPFLLFRSPPISYIAYGVPSPTVDRQRICDDAALPPKRNIAPWAETSVLLCATFLGATMGIMSRPNTGDRRKTENSGAKPLLVSPPNRRWIANRKSDPEQPDFSLL